MDQVNKGFDQNHHPSEIISICEESDKRYSDISSLKISEYEIQKQSKVLQKLQELPYFDSFVDLEQKKEQTNNFFVRHTLLYNKLCESEFSKSQVV